jgi:hypothetical protein
MGRSQPPPDFRPPRFPSGMRSLTELASRVESLGRSPRLRYVLLILLLAFGARHVSRGMGDYKTYERAARRAVAGETIYRLSDPHRYLYAPVVTFLFFPLAVLPRVAGKVLWIVFNLALVASIFRCSAALVFPEGRAPPGFYALLLLLSFRFIDNNLGHGQINILLLWLVLKAYALAAEQRHGLAGLAMAAAIATKIVPLVFLVQIVLRRQWRFAAWTLGGFAVLTVAPFAWWGASYPGLLRDWTAVVIDQAGHYEMGNKINQSISAFAYRALQPYPDGYPLIDLAPAIVNAIVLALHVTFWVPLLATSLRLGAARETEPHGPGGDELSLYLLYSTVASPYSWKYYFVNLVFPLAAASRRLWGPEPERSRFRTGLVVVFILNLLPGFELIGKRASTAFQLGSLHFLAVVVLFVLLARPALRGRSFPSSDTVC